MSTFNIDPAKFLQIPRISHAEWCMRYIGRIKNGAKRQYADAYFAFLRDGGQEPTHEGLGAMAAQAVRLNLAKPDPTFYRS